MSALVMSSNDEKSSNDIIVLDDDDNMDTIKRTNCINYLCKSGLELMKPPVFCSSYFRIKGKANGQQVCKACFEIAANHFELLSDALKDGKDLLSISLPKIHETVALDSDSDDEDDEGEGLLDETTREFLAEHLNEVLEDCNMKYDCANIMENTLKELNQRVNATSDSLLEVKTMSDSVRKEFDLMLYTLSNALRVDNREQPELMVYDEADAIPSPPQQQNVPAMPLSQPPTNLPKRAPLIRPLLRINQFYYARKTDAGLASWVKVKLENIIPPGSKINDILLRVTMYQVYREVGGRETRRFVDGRSIAYSAPLSTMLEIGTRVIALFHDTQTKKGDSYYPGIVGEFPSAFNNFRYLIFFDDGYAFYVDHNDVFMIYECSKDVWDDVYFESRAFIKKYLTEYPNRSMVKLLKNQTVRTEYKGKWYMTTVLQVDCSLVQMYFGMIHRTEWIYRGSRRLNTMYQEEQAASNRLQHKQRNARARNRPANVTGAPYVQYSSVRDDSDVVFVSQGPLEKPEQRAVAKKSTRPPLPSSIDSSSERSANSVQREETTPGKIVYYTPRKQCPTKKIYVPHKCSPLCQQQLQATLSRLKGYGPLAKPLLCGYHRIHYKAKSRRPFIIYKTPCGRTTRNIGELHQYLEMTKSDFSVDLFNFEPWVRCLAEFILEPNAILNKDLSDGQEQIQVPVVNYIDGRTNDFVNYSTRRMPMEGVNLNLDPEFLCGCDCEDDCADKTKCACWQLTLEGSKYLYKDGDLKDPLDVGYEYRRLMEPLITGIYECNSRCKCSKTCLNRVVQNPLQHKLQIFMTSNRGWGIRCINDIPKGAFICIYAGSLLTDEAANEGGQNVSDEYYAELDFIESAELIKQDYEEEAYKSEDESTPTAPTNRIFDNGNSAGKKVLITSAGSKSNTGSTTSLTDNTQIQTSSVGDAVEMGAAQEEESIRSRLRKRDVEINYKKMQDDAVNISDEEDVVVREPSSFNPKESDIGAAAVSRYPSVRTMFGKNESVYIMDAKCTGNLGRFLNHSCSPNVFVQNVFVDTHDLRFPWVSFFAMQFIRAGTELTWNYNYDVGSVEDKVLYCNCGSPDCKGRLL